MKNLILLLPCLCLISCAVSQGGASYKYSHKNPNGANTTIEVDSVREAGETTVDIDPATGKFKVTVDHLKPGENNLGEALGIIKSLVPAAATVAK